METSYVLEVFVLKLSKCLVTAIAFLAALLCLTCGNVKADDTCLGRMPDGVFPIGEDDISMEEETVVVDLTKNTARCEFHFYNSGEDKTILMGFPGVLTDNSDHTGPVNLTVHNFKAYIDGKQVAIKKEKNTVRNDPEKPYDKFSEWFTFEVHLKAGKSVTVKNTYSFYPTYDSMSFIYSGYVMRTGAAWKGNIGKAKVTFKLGDMKPYYITDLYPGKFRFAGNELIWENSDFEPTYDLNVTYNESRIKNSKEYAENFGYSSEEIDKNVKQFKEADRLAEQKNEQELIKRYNEAIAARQNVLAVYIKSQLPQGRLEEKTSIGDINVEKRGDGYFYIWCDIFGTPEKQSKTTISHADNNGKKIIDAENSNYFECRLEPAVDYEILCQVTDWKGDIIEKSTRYLTPISIEKADNSAAAQTISAYSLKNSNNNTAGMEEISDKAIITVSAVITVAAACIGAVIFLNKKRKV